MPSSKTHYFFTNQSYQQDVTILPFLHEHQDVVLLTAQGPDPFMFYGNIPYRKRANKVGINQLATRLHQDKDLIISKFHKFYQYALQQDTKNQAILLAAIYGELAHYALDNNCHPYVFYVTGYIYGIDEVSYFVDHSRFETMIDTELERIHQRKVQSHNIIHCDPNKVKIISKMYAACVEGLLEDDYYHGYLDMMTIEKVLFDRWGIKKFLLSLLGMKQHYAHALSHYPRKKKNDAIDYLNELKSTWLYPDTGKESQASFLQLMEKAHQQLKDMINLFHDGDILKLDHQLSQRNYDGIAYGSKHLFGKSVYKQ